MKLQARYTRVNIITTVSILLLSGLCYYFILRFFLIDQLDNDLKIEEQEFTDYVAANKALPNTADYKDQQLFYAQANEPVKRKFISAAIADGKEQEVSRQLIFPVELQGQLWKVTIAKSEEETDDLIELIVWITLAVVALLLLALFIINRFMLNKLWEPFIDTLKQVQQFNVSTRKPLQLVDNNINEFKELNTAVKIMSHKVLQDYDTLKSFTENASHEMQTPLAVVNSKLDLLMQADNFTEAQMYNIQVIHEEINRLSKLNAALLLLTKIDNDQFSEKEPVNLAAIIVKRLQNYEELILAKHIALQTTLDDKAEVFINENLAQVMVSNLITNAIKHNIDHGKINIALSPQQLVITNTGEALQVMPEALFERFKKSDAASESLGLGLSIVKKIGDRNGFHIDYAYSTPLHTITVNFPQ